MSKVQAVESRADTIKHLVERIAHEAPSLESLTYDQLTTLARIVVTENLKDELRGKADLARIKYQDERQSFLAHAGRIQSDHTARAYAAALSKLEAWAAYQGLVIPGMQAKDADDFAYYLASEGRSSASVRRDIAAVSSMFTFLERRFACIRNPFRGTKARPANLKKKPVRFPTDQELAFIFSALALDIRAAVAVMVYRGLRVGSLPSITIRSGRFTARSKGKDITGEMPEHVLDYIREAALDIRQPFIKYTATKLADRFRYMTKSLAYSGAIAKPYSVHDLRHYYAVCEYKKDKDLLRVKNLLGHASVQVTELYLRNMGEL
jgi:site-specific recombinase XerD